MKRAVSRILSALHAKEAVIHLELTSLSISSNLPDTTDTASSYMFVKTLYPIWFCTERGFHCHVHYWTRGALLPHHFTLTVLQQRYIFCCTIRRL